MVMRSAAGFYIGRACLETDENSAEYYGGDEEPFSRESEDYFSSEEAATAALNEMFVVRNCGENNFAYEQDTLSLNAT